MGAFAFPTQTYMTDKTTEYQLGEMNAKLDAVLKALDERLPKLEARLTKVERWQWMVMGAGTALGAILGYALKML